jgi:hypothetical protein
MSSLLVNAGSTEEPTRSVLTLQKWESKLLETRVAEFARAPGAGASSSPEPDASGPDPNAAGPSGTGLSGASTGAGANDFGMGYPQAGAGLPAQGLALPGMAMNGMRGYTGYDGVKPETDDILRMRGGSVGPVSADGVRCGLLPPPVRGVSSDLMLTSDSEPRRRYKAIHVESSET